MTAYAITNRGGRPYQEDRVVMHHDFRGRFSVYAVFDGHGGAAVAELCQRSLVKQLRQLIGERVWRLSDAHVLMGALFARLDAAAQALNLPNVGCTAVIALVMKGHVICANAGDSRAIMGSRHQQALTLTRDHKVQDEVGRLVAAGATITRAPGDTPRISHGLNLARSIGDHAVKRFVTSSPFVSVYPAPQAGGYILLASDGVWDVMSAREVHAMVAVTARRRDADACRATLRSIVRRCRELHSTDNVAIVLAPVEAPAGARR